MIFLLLLFFKVASLETQAMQDGFVYNGFRGSNITLGGEAEIISNGLLRLTNTSKRQIGQAFYSLPLSFKNPPTASVLSFSTTFVLAIVSANPDANGQGMAFVLSPSKPLLNTETDFMGLFNLSNNGNSSNHIFAVDFDTVQSAVFKDPSNNHVGIDNNSIISVKSIDAAYFDEKDRRTRNLSLASGDPIQVWVDYNGYTKQIEVTISPLNTSRPVRPLLSMDIDLSPTILDSMYVGFSAATGTALVSSHYVLGWSFKMNGQAQALDLSRLPKLPRIGPKKKSKFLTIGVPIIVVFFILSTFASFVFVIRRRIKYAELLEDWEREYGPHRFSYKVLFKATKGFKERQLLGEGGFGMVYRGVLPSSKVQVAVKRVSHKSKQGMREFVAEIVSLGRLRHRNLVQLLGYCRRQGELLLVYDYMPNGSLNKFLFGQSDRTLDWYQRSRIIKGVASGLLYLHEEWEQVVLHRDIKASNVLLDSEFNGRLGDFGLARLYDHGSNPQTTHVVGTLGYMAPELTRTGKATTGTDVYAFGVFMLEVACGKRPIGDMVLVDWVWACWKRGELAQARDARLDLRGDNFVKKEIELVLKLGLLCAHPIDASRPSMREVMMHLEGSCEVPDILSNKWRAFRVRDEEHLYETGSSHATEKSSLELYTSSYVESVLSGGR